MRRFALLLVLLTALACVLLVKTLGYGPPAHRPRRLEAPDPPAARPIRGAAVLRDVLIEKTDGEGTRHALISGSRRRGLYYRGEGGEEVLLDPGARVGASLDLAVGDRRRVYAAYWDADTGEVRLASPPRGWTALKRAESPNRITLSTDPEGVLVSFYEESEEILYYSYVSFDGTRTRQGVAGRGGNYRVVRGRPGALVLGR